MQQRGAITGPDGGQWEGFSRNQSRLRRASWPTGRRRCKRTDKRQLGFAPPVLLAIHLGLECQCLQCRGLALHGAETEFPFEFPPVAGASATFPNFQSLGVINSDSGGLSRECEDGEYSTARPVQDSKRLVDRGSEDSGRTARSYFVYQRSSCWRHSDNQFPVSGSQVFRATDTWVVCDLGPFPLLLPW